MTRTSRGLPFMTERSDGQCGFAGMTVAAFESRMATEMATLIARYGGKPVVGPSMQEIPLENNVEALDFGHRLLSGTIDVLILLTGVGVRTLLDVWNTRFPWEAVKPALTRTTLVARGPKPTAVLKELGVKPHLVVPEPNTWEDVLHALDAFKPEGLRRLNVGVQEYGLPNQDLVAGLVQRGATVTTVPVYRWSLPDDVAPLKKTLRSVLDGNVAVVCFTSAVQIDHVVDVLRVTNEVEAFRQALRNTIVASIGPMTSRRLRHYQFPVDVEPTHPKMGILLKEVSEQAGRLLQKKHENSRGTPVNPPHETHPD